MTAALAMYDAMQYVRPLVEPTCLGVAASGASLLLSAGAPGRRLALPNSLVVIHQPWAQGMQGQATDLDVHAREIVGLSDAFIRVIAQEPCFSFKAVTKGRLNVHEDHSAGDIASVIVGRKSRSGPADRDIAPRPEGCTQSLRSHNPTAQTEQKEWNGNLREAEERLLKKPSHGVTVRVMTWLSVAPVSCPEAVTLKV